MAKPNNQNWGEVGNKAVNYGRHTAKNNVERRVKRAEALKVWRALYGPIVTQVWEGIGVPVTFEIWGD